MLGTMRRGGAVAVGLGLLVAGGACTDDRERFPPCASCFPSGPGGAISGAGGGGGGGPGGGVPGAELEWIGVYGDDQLQVPAGVAADDSGNAYVVGYYGGEVDFGGGVQLTATAGIDGFVVKLDPAGDAVWAHSFGQHSATTDPKLEDMAVAVDPSGNVLVAGSVENTVTIGTSNPTSYTMSGARPDVFVAKLDPDGQHLWSRHTATLAAYTAVQGVASDGMGNVYVVGYADGATTEVFGTVIGVEYCAFVAKLDGATGDTLWVTLLEHDSHYFILFDMDVDDAGNVALGGYFQDNLTAGSTVLSGSGTSNDIVAAMLDAAGNVSWARGFGASGTERAHGVAFGAAGVVLSGVMRGTVDFDGTVLTSSETDIFLTTLDDGGMLVSAEGFVDPRNQGTNDLASGPLGVVALTGIFGSELGIAGSRLVDRGQSDMFVVKLGASGPEWAVAIGSAGEDAGIGVAVDSASRITAVGFVTGDIVTGTGTTLAHAGGRDLVVARFKP